MQIRPRLATSLTYWSLVLLLLIPSFSVAEESNRRTPLVDAVRSSMHSIVNLRGRKTVREGKDEHGKEKEIKHVNGMGTGVVIDSRGYVLTNYHVVQDVRQIQVTTSTKESTTARVIAHDSETDLAILKIETNSPLPVINSGTSDDLMLAETVAAIGNAYGYEHTVTVGIVSQLGRTVRVNEKQVYRNLIQTDSSINPGNSGGPLLNLDGEMIGINVAVRVGAQGIAFAIPVNDALETASRMLNNVVREDFDHGVTVQTIYIENQPQTLVTNVVRGSLGDKAGISKGDRVVRSGAIDVERAIDFQRSMLDLDSANFQVVVQRGEKQKVCSLEVQSSGVRVDSVAWNQLGIQVIQATDDEMEDRHPNYQRGLKILKVRPGSPADEAHIMPGDVLVAMHGWKTESKENLAYVLKQESAENKEQFMFYILRDQERFFGHIRIASSE